MMRLKAFLGGLAAAALAAQPAAAASMPRASAPSEGESAMGGDGGIIGLAVFAAAVLAFFLIAESDNDDEPASP